MILLLCNLQLLCPAKQSPAWCSSALCKRWGQFSFCTRCVTGCAAAVMYKPLTSFSSFSWRFCMEQWKKFLTALTHLWKWFPVIQDSDSPVNLGRKEPHKGFFSVSASHNHESISGGIQGFCSWIWHSQEPLVAVKLKTFLFSKLEHEFSFRQPVLA